MKNVMPVVIECRLGGELDVDVVAQAQISSIGQANKPCCCKKISSLSPVSPDYTVSHTWSFS